MKSIWAGMGRLLLFWTVASTLSGAIMYPLSLVIADLLNLHIIAAVMLGSLVGGLIAGLPQSGLLKPYLRLQRDWVLMTVIGWAIALPLLIAITLLIRGWVVDLSDGYALTLYLLGAGTAGAVAGLGQWSLLRRVFERASWWLLASGVGWFMAWLAVLGFAWLLGQEQLPVSSSGADVALGLGALAGWLVGLEQGIALIGLVAQSAWERRENSVE